MSVLMRSRLVVPRQTFERIVVAMGVLVTIATLTLNAAAYRVSGERPTRRCSPPAQPNAPPECREGLVVLPEAAAPSTDGSGKDTDRLMAFDGAPKPGVQWWANRAKKPCHDALPAQRR
jgi:hypothetical protein